MNRQLALAGTNALLLLALTAPGTFGQASDQVPATSVFRDAGNDRIRSDSSAPGSWPGAPAYTDGVDCVGTWVTSKGFFVLATVDTEDPCSQPLLASGDSIRHIILDFSEQLLPTPTCSVTDTDSVKTLNICGPNVLPHVVFRAELFAARATRRGEVGVLPVLFDPRVEIGLDFQLRFEEPLRVILTNDPNTRILTTDGVSAVAELWQVDRNAKRHSLGLYNMPFALQVTKLQ